MTELDADELRHAAAILRAGVPQRRDVRRLADDLERQADIDLAETNSDLLAALIRRGELLDAERALTDEGAAVLTAVLDEMAVEQMAPTNHADCQAWLARWREARGQ